MGIIAWIVLGVGVSLPANMLIPGRRSQGLVITCVAGAAGAALLGSWLATKLFHVVSLHGFFNLSTVLTAIGGAAILLAGALGLLLSLLVWGPLNPAHRHRDSNRSYDGGTPVLVRPEKRLSQDPGRRPLVDKRGLYQGEPPL